MPRNTLIITQYKNNYNETIWVSTNFAFYGREFNQLKKKVTSHVICPQWISKSRCRITSLRTVFHFFAHIIVFLSINTFHFGIITVQYNTTREYTYSLHTGLTFLFLLSSNTYNSPGISRESLSRTSVPILPHRRPSEFLLSLSFLHSDITIPLNLPLLYVKTL